jgi:hypothetical protein
VLPRRRAKAVAKVSRVSDGELRELVEARDGEPLTPYTDDANVLVNETLDLPLFSDDRLRLIEKYLAAHLWVIAKEKGGLTSEKALDATNTYQKYSGTGLSATRFGQQVMVFDFTGALDKVLSYSKKAQLRVV